MNGVSGRQLLLDTYILIQVIQIIHKIVYHTIKVAIK